MAASSVSIAEDKFLGKGAYGSVYLHYDEKTESLVAVKRIDVGPVSSEDANIQKAVKAVHNEISMMKYLNHKRIVQYIRAEQQSNIFSIYMEYVSGGSVADLIKDGPLSEDATKRHTLQLLEGLSYLHGKNIIHRDVKGSNILCDDNGNIKLADFGISKQMDHLHTLTNKVGKNTAMKGTAYWMAPEVIKAEDYGTRADIWSTAATVIEMLTAHPPWHKLEQMQAMFKIATLEKGGYALDSKISRDAEDFLTPTFMLEEQRPRADELLQHSWLKAAYVLTGDQNKVHSQFPIPLINRLEKHYVSATSLLTGDQKKVKDQLEVWMEKFVTPSKQNMKSAPPNCEGCGKHLTEPYKLPCSEQHYVGECCREDLFHKSEYAQVCPVETCNEPIGYLFEWKVDKQALESRQYFENSTVSSSFIGYSPESTAAAVVQKATEDVFKTPPSYDKLMDLVFEHSKTYLLQCATAECILRLDRTVLKDEAFKIQNIYLQDQHHENLFQYLDHELTRAADRSLQIQATTFAELMNHQDIDTLKFHMNLHEDIYEISTINWKDFPKESLFTDSVKTFYGRAAHSKAKLLVIQCESANASIELLDSVRYIIQRETPTLAGSNHAVLLLSVARGHPFTGYQGGNWKCVHIDDLRSPHFKLPSLRKCMTIKPCEVIGSAIKVLMTPQSGEMTMKMCLRP